jgi:hypothetical protein
LPLPIKTRSSLGSFKNKVKNGLMSSVPKWMTPMM